MRTLYMLFLTLQLLIVPFIGKAQQDIKKLMPGDRLPEIYLKNLINFPKGEAPLSDFYSPLLLLDFMNIHCSTSVSNFAKLDSLQEKFEGKLNIIRITRATDRDLNALKARSEPARNSRLSIIHSDSIFSKLFPIKLPHQAWIDKNGVVIAITSAQNASVKNVQAVLSGEKIKLLPMHHFEDFNAKMPLFSNASVGILEHTRQYSFFTGFINGIHTPMSTSSDPASKKVIRRAFYNTSIVNLFKHAYGGFSESRLGIPTDNRKVILEVDNPSKFIGPADPADVLPWQWDNSYCYEIQVRPEDTNQLAENMKRDLSAFFKVNAGLEKRKISGYALVKTGGNKTLKTAGGFPLRSFHTIDRYYELRNQPVGTLVNILMNCLSRDLIADETGIITNVDAKIYESGDLQSIRKNLKEYGLDLVKKDIEVEMLVIRDRR